MNKRVSRLAPLLVLLTLAAACAKAPPDLTPAATTLWQANEAVLILDRVRDAAIALNTIRLDDTRLLLSEANTRAVVTAHRAAILTIAQVPMGWRSTTDSALTNIANALDAEGLGKFRPYLDSARAILLAIK